jgi:hypothetical protein
MKIEPPAYHLRTNKSVERVLFVELLRRIGPHLPYKMERYRYVGMGGPYLADFSEIQMVWGCRKMTSLETEPHVVARQKFNRPHCRITLTNESTGQFAERYVPGSDPLVVWFDYTKQDWDKQIRECCELIPKLPNGSVFKVSFKSTPNSLYDGPSLDKPTERARILGEMFGAYGPFSPDDLHFKNFPKTLLHIFKRAIKRTLGDTDAFVVHPLASFLYSDGTPMVTITVLVGSREMVDSLLVKSGLKLWPYSDLVWAGPRIINIPNLSLRERLAIDRYLPDKDVETIVSRLKLSLAKEKDETLDILRRYVDFAKHVPQFLRVTH